MDDTKTGNARGLSRRQLLTTAAGVGAAGIGAQLLGAPFVNRAWAADPIRIGMLWAKTGSIVDQAEYLAQGCQLALEQRGNKILDRPVDLVWLDEPSPQGAQQNAERLISEQGAVALIGGAMSSLALAESAVANKHKVPFIAPNAAADSLTGSACNPYTFRGQPPVSVHTKVLAPYCAGIGKKWYLLTAAYAFGQDIADNFRHYIEANGGEVVGADSVPIGTPDYSSYILKIRAAQPDVVIGGISASDLTTFLKQWKELGMSSKIPFAEIAVGNTDLWGVGAQAAAGLYTLTWYYKNPDNPADEQEMAEQYQKKYNRPAADKTWMGWFGMRSLLSSIEAAGSTESGKLVKALTEWKVRRNGIDVTYRDFDHQMINRLLVAGIKPKITDKWDFFDVKAELPKTPADIEAAYGTEAQSACKMPTI
ncbi:ABC transporter substrate-binding protein [Acidimangrovimonas sediminis]|uniref:ABC transporter substrate-binding protein n=1 Tax=Acidimangrovimonas sediminis TaxID=2056283 RepID=UPI000C809EED|nr:ABC transporter substrate-binding protein [Acidimangrovimonas sediminis]